MKKLLIFGIAVMGIALASCNKSEVAANSTTSTLSNAGALDTTKTGATIAISALPSAITTYLSKNYSGAITNAAHYDTDGSIDVDITTSAGVKTHLEFTAAGVFVSASTNPFGKGGTKPNGGQNGGKDSVAAVAVSALSSTIKTYITSNYSGATTNNAYTEKDGDFVVNITTSSGVKAHLEFTAAGVFISAMTNAGKPINTSTVVAVSALPTTITTYISTTYAGATISSAHTESSTGYYDVTIITAAKATVNLYFTAAGVFVKTH